MDSWDKRPAAAEAPGPPRRGCDALGLLEPPLQLLAVVAFGHREAKLRQK
jgi:hypothetical protein